MIAYRDEPSFGEVINFVSSSDIFLIPLTATASYIGGAYCTEEQITTESCCDCKCTDLLYNYKLSFIMADQYDGLDEAALKEMVSVVVQI